ncbi:hypothetical protein VKT23_019083 [Stygiomarasmius scandens]|uniref:Protein-S-isoprenylcysteine O-methyltransferase n=1 Tax=Marasmiellus scandens TaxID=2682957 RepID=A0ABR1IRB9_9AGAR
MLSELYGSLRVFGPYRPLLRLPFTLATLWGIHTSMSPPTPPPAEDELEEKRSGPQKTSPSNKKAKTDNGFMVRFREGILLKLLPLVVKRIFHVFVSIELAFALLQVFNSNPSSPSTRRFIKFLTPATHSSVDRWTYITDVLQPTPQLILGTVLALSGGLIRRACYAAMREMFTFELSIRKEHKLVTWGPYAYLRHPGYTAAIMAGSGTLLALVVGRGSWSRECLWPMIASAFRTLFSGNQTPPLGLEPVRTLDFDMPVTISVLINAIFLALVIFGPRARKEDEMMEREFGNDWRNWRKRVRWGLLWGVY